MSSLEEAALVFEKYFKDILDDHAPVKIIQVRKNYLPYLSDNTKAIISNRKAIQEEAVKTGCKILKSEFNRLSKDVKKCIAADKRAYYEEKFRRFETSSSVWQASRDIIGVSKNLSPTAILHQNSDNSHPSMVSKPEQLANIFNKYFINKVSKLRNSSRVVPNINPVSRLRSWLATREDILPDFSLRKIDKKGLRRAIKKLKGKRVSGVDTIDSYSLKLAAPLIEDALLHLVNLSIESKAFARNWKPQLILPLHKKKEKSKVENYRPVSNLVEVGKLVEYVIGEQILAHFLKNNLIHPNHHGSIPNHSTSTALIHLIDMWIQAAENRELSGVCMIDQSTAL